MVFMPVFWGCQEEEVAAGYEIPEVKKVADFVDSDGKVYRCIEVGDLIWMADNLAKRLPLGGREGGKNFRCRLECDRGNKENFTGTQLFITDQE